MLAKGGAARDKPPQLPNASASSAGPLQGPQSPSAKKAPKEPFAKQLLRYKDYQTGFDLTIGGYRILQPLSAGTQGDVFHGATASSTALLLEGRTEVAMKRARTSNHAIQKHVLQEFAAVFHARSRYGDEIGNSRSTGHPHIVAYLDWFAGPVGLEREVWLIMEKCEFALNDVLYTANHARSQYERRFTEFAAQQRAAQGRAANSAAARDVLAKRPNLVAEPLLYRFPEREVAKVILHMLLALEFLNRHGVLHRDVKTENILWTCNGRDEGLYKLADFGTATIVVDGEAARREQDCGTLWTMAPEVIGRRPHSFNCDVWSTACVAFEVATLEKPFNSKELLAYKNSDEAAHEGSFWPVLCGNLGSPHSGGGGNSTQSLSSPQTSPSSLRMPPKRASTPTLGATRTPMKKNAPLVASKATQPPKGDGQATVGRGMGRQASLPALVPPLGLSKRRKCPGKLDTSLSDGVPCAGKLSDAETREDLLPQLMQSPNSRSISGGSSSPTYGDQDKLKECASLMREVDNLCDVVRYSKDVSRAIVSLDAGVIERGGGDESQQWSPKSSDAVSSPKLDAHRKQKNALLRKRGAGRWGYSDELRGVIFDDMLDEDTAQRPTAGALLQEASRASLLFRQHGLRLDSFGLANETGGQEPGNALNGQRLRDDVEEKNATVKEIPVTETKEIFSMAPGNVANFLRVVTPEAFLQAMRPEQQKQKITEDAVDKDGDVKRLEASDLI